MQHSGTILAILASMCTALLSVLSTELWNTMRAVKKAEDARLMRGSAEKSA